MVEKKLFETLCSFYELEDMVLYLTGYLWELLECAMGKENEKIFSDAMLSQRLIKEIARKEDLEEMEKYLKDYCRKILQKAMEKKGKEILKHWVSLSGAQRYDILEAIGVNVDRKHAGRRGMNTFERQGTLATNFGDLIYKRYGAIVPTMNNSYRYYVPLDDYLNLIPGIHYPKNVLKKIGKDITKMSYRQTADSLKQIGISITQATVWNLVRDIIAPRIYDLEKKWTLSHLLEKDDEIGTTKEIISTLFIEWDGVWLSLDNTKDKTQKSGKKKELKLGKAYIGWAKRYGKEDKSSYETVGTRYVAGFEAPEVLREMLNGKIHEAFEYADVKQIIVGGDGANWIFQDYEEDARVILQLDMFHIRQKINRSIKDKAQKKKIVKLLKEDKYLEITEMLREDIENRCRTDNVKKEKELLEYFDNNFGSLRRYQKVAYVKLKEEKNLEARNLGTMEASVRQVIGRRMTMSAWSMKGAKALATMLCLEHEGKLDKVLDIVLDRQYQIEYADICLPDFIKEYKEGKDKEQVLKGREANQKVVAKGRYAAAITNVDINLKKIIEMNNAQKYLPKDIL